MRFIFERRSWAAVLVEERRFPAMAGASWVTALEDETGDQAVEDSAGVVAVEAVLEEGAGGERGLFGEEFEEEVAGGRGEEDFGGGLGLEVVDGCHCGGGGGVGGKWWLWRWRVSRVMELE